MNTLEPITRIVNAQLSSSLDVLTQTFFSLFSSRKYDRTVSFHWYQGIASMIEERFSPLEQSAIAQPGPPTQRLLTRPTPRAQTFGHRPQRQHR